MADGKDTDRNGIGITKIAAVLVVLGVVAAGAYWWSTRTSRSLEALNSPDEATRLAAVRTLAHANTESTEVRNALRDALLDSSGRVRKVAAQSLSAISWQPETSVDRANLAIASGDFTAALAEGTDAMRALENALNGTNSEAIVQTLENGKVKSEDVDGQLAALLAIGGIKSAKGMNLLNSKLTGGSDVEKAVSALILGKESELESLDGTGIANAVWLLYNSEKPSHRIFAVELWTKLKALPQLKETLQDNSHEVRAATARGLGKIGSEAAIKALQKLLADDAPPVRRAALEALAQSSNPVAIPLLLEALNDPETADLAAKGLATFTDPENLKQLKGMLSHEQAEIRAIGAQLLARIESDQVEPLLLSLLEDPVEDVRRSALNSLNTRGWTPASSRELALVAYIKNDAAAMEKLAEPGNASLVPLLASILKDPSSTVSATAAKVLGTVGGDAAQSPLMLALSDARESVRQAAALALCKIGAAEAVPAILAAISNKRIDGSSTAKALENVSATQAFAKALSDDNPVVRQIAAKALGEQYAREASAALIKAIDDEDPAVASAAIVALGRLKTREASEPLSKALKHENPNVRRWAVWALGEIKDPKSVNAIVGVLDDKNPSLQKMAGSVLSRMKSPTVINSLTDMLQSPKENARSAAASALKRMDWTPETAEQRALLAAASGDLAAAFAQGAKAREALVLATNSTDAATRELSLILLGELQDKAVLPTLTGILEDDPENAVQAQAARSMGRINGGEAAVPLLNALKTAKGDTLIAVAESLGACKAREAAVPLTEVLNDSRLAAMSDSRRTQAQLAILKALGHLNDPIAVTTLGQAAINAKYSSAVRAQAATALAKIGGESAEKYLLAVLAKENDPDVRKKTIAAFDTIKAPATLKGLIALANGKEKALQKDARTVLSSAKVHGDLASDLIASAKEARGATRDALLAAVGNLQGQSAVAPLSLELEADDDDLRIAAATGLGSTQASEAYFPLVEVLKPTGFFRKKTDVSEAAAAALGVLGDKRAASKLVDVLEYEDVAPNAIDALVKINAKSALGEIAKQRQSDEEDVRVAVANAIGALGGKDNVFELKILAADSDIEVRKAAIEALGRVGGSEAVKVLSDAVSDKNASIRKVAIEALGETRDASAINTLTAQLSKEHAVLAIQSLSRIGGSQALSSLITAANGGSDAVRKAAIRGLGNINDPQAVQVLEKELNGPNALAAIKALGQIDSPEARAALVNKLAQNLDKEDIRKAVTDALVGKK